MKKYAVFCSTLIFLFISVKHVGAQSNAMASVKITGEVTKPIVVLGADLKNLSRVSVDRNDRDGKIHHYTGVMLTTLLGQAGAALGKELRGENLTKYVLVEASDGYQVSFALAELDADFSDEKIILADQMDDKPLPLADGPFRIIVQHDKRPARCIKQVSMLKVGFAK